MVLGLVSSALATDYTWTGDYPWSYLWISPWNWDPVAPYGGPGNDGDPCTCCPNPDSATIAGLVTCVLDTDACIHEIRGPAWDNGADGDQLFLIHKDANLEVCYRWHVRYTVPSTAYIEVRDSAQVYVDNDFRSHGDHSRTIMTITDDASVIINGDLRCGDADDDYFELNMDSGYLYTGNRDDGWRFDSGEAHADISGDAVVESEFIRWRTRTGGTTSTFTVRDDAQVTVTDDEFRFAGGAATVVISILDNAVVDVQNDNVRLGEDNDFAGTCTLNMSGQLLNMDGDFRFIADNDATGFTTVNLDSGVINTEGGLDYDTDNWLVNICGDGVWIVDGDRVAQTLDEAENWYQVGRTPTLPGGHWRACPMEDCRGEIVDRGTLMVDYDNVNPGKTTIWSELNLDQAWSPLPVDGATDVPCQGTSLCWCPSDMDVKLYHVWFSTDKDLVDSRDVRAFAAQVWPPCEPDCCWTPPDCLKLSTTYYWAVDAQDHYTNIVRGNTWTFEVTHCTMIEDFESYTLDPWNEIYKAWLDGCGIWVGDQLVGNGTGSCVNLGMENTHHGAKAMIYTYENDLMSLWERDVNYSEACKEFDPALDLDCCDDKALVIYFYGDPDNDVTDMWVKVNGVKSTYGDGDLWWENPADIQSAEWLDWNTELSEFADGGADLTAVTEICIGFGDDETNIADGTYGMMLFDCIQSCEPRCVLRALPYCFGDHTGDCIVDWRDVKVIADNWLEDLR
jgi:hypothetical protein